MTPPAIVIHREYHPDPARQAAAVLAVLGVPEARELPAVPPATGTTTPPSGGR
jgi:hypothetical protein